MGRTTQNMLANFAGRIWSLVLGVVLVPIYVHFLGIEAYGLIGVYTALQSLVSLLDFGLGMTLNRQLAQYARQGGQGAAMREFTRTVELVYWGAAAVFAIALAMLSPVIAARWIHAAHLSTSQIQQSVLLMGVAVALQFPSTLYGGGLLGLQRHVSYNLLLMAVGALRGAGAVLLFVFVARDVEVFFAWQVAASTLQSVAAGLILWRFLDPSTERPRFSPRVLRGVWRFAAGAGGSAIVGLLVAQIDKVVLTRMLSLDDFGYYSLAGVLGSSLYVLAVPFHMTYFPKFSALVAADDTASLVPLYHRACQLLSVLILPGAAVAALFAREVLTLWTRNPVIALRTADIASMLVASYALTALNLIPYTMQLAYGWTRLTFTLSISMLCAAVPVITLAALRFGAIGVAASWIILNGSYTLLLVRFMHRRLLRGEGLYWGFVDVGLPLCAGIFVAGGARVLLPSGLTGLPLLGYIGATSILAMAAAAVATPAPRALVTVLAHRFFARGEYAM